MRVVCYGDSNTLANNSYEYVQLIRDDHPNWEVVDRGINGAPSEAITQDVEGSIDTYNSVDIVTVMMGVNDARINGLDCWKCDLYSPYLASEYYDRITRIVEAVEAAHPNAKIIFITPNQCGDYYAYSDMLDPDKNHFVGYIDQYVKKIKEWDADNPGRILVADAYTAMAEKWQDNLAWDYLMADHWHPNDLGHYVIYCELEPLLGSSQPESVVRRLGLFLGWDQHKSIIEDVPRFSEMMDREGVFNDITIFFSTLWHFDPDGQRGYQAIDDLLTEMDGTDKRMWLSVCFDFGSESEWTKYKNLIRGLSNHSSLYAVGVCTDEWSRFPDTEQECKEKFLDLHNFVRGELSINSYCHLFFGWGGSQGPMPDGNAWFCNTYDKVLFHNNYPHFDQEGVNNLSVLRSMLDRGYGDACVGGTQGYFPSTWTDENFEAVIDDFELVEDPTKAQVLMLALGNPEQNVSALRPVMESYGDWKLDSAGVRTLEITGSKLGCNVTGTSLAIPTKKEIALSASGSWTENGFLVTVTTSPVEAGVEIAADGVVKGTTNTEGTFSFLV